MELEDAKNHFPAVPSQCSSCDLTSNLWLCLTCGLANCGRQQFGGIGGNGHALKHFHETGHMLGVKLGTITPEGTAGKSFFSFFKGSYIFHHAKQRK